MDQRGFQVQVAQDQVLNVFYSFFGYTLSYHLGFTQDDLQLQIMYNVCILQHAPRPKTNLGCLDKRDSRKIQRVKCKCE